MKHQEWKEQGGDNTIYFFSIRAEGHCQLSGMGRAGLIKEN